MVDSRLPGSLLPIFSLSLFFVWMLVPLPALATASTSVTPVETNDTFLGKQWYLDAIQARQGWHVATGSRDVIVAVVDSGVDIAHPDLKENIWINPNEVPDNGKDDDGDGYVDDVHGWNFVTDSADVNPIRAANGVSEAWVHGTVVASLIAAHGNNNVGISGVAWRARIVPLVALGPDGYGRDDAIVRAIRYAVAHNADIINLSLVGYEYNADLSQAIHEATSQGVLVVSAAGNSDTNPRGENLDTLPGYPACDKGAAGRGELSVTALTRDNVKAPQANYGTCVDVSAPGFDLYAARPTTDPAGMLQGVAGYMGSLDGTSVAAPLVAGLAALLKAQHPTWQGPELAERIISTADVVDIQNPEYAGKLGRGRINVARALAQDDVAERLGPLTLEVTAVGHAPEVRVRTATGKELSRFSVAERGDMRGVRATFVRWQGRAEPDIVVTMTGDSHGAWRVYRPDGLMIAAGEVGTDVRGGLTVAAQDLSFEGRDQLLFGEQAGSRAWLISSADGVARPLSLFKNPVTGVNALSVTRPTPSFLVTGTFGSRDVHVVGKEGVTLVSGRATTVSKTSAWVGRRGTRVGGGSVYDLASLNEHIVFVNDANGLRASKGSVAINRWMQIPAGEPTESGWRFVELWPR